jgi:hypothetical protein
MNGKGDKVMVHRFSWQRLQRQSASPARFVTLGLLCLLIIPFTCLAEENSGKSDKAGSLTLPIGGSFTGGNFAGNLNIQRFIHVNGQVKALGTISGTLNNYAGVPQRSTLQGQLLLPVTVGPAATAALEPTEGANSKVAAMSFPMARPILFLLTVGSPVASFAASPQPQQTCQPVDISIGAISFNVAGLTVTTTPVSLTLGGQTGGSNALGTLVCNLLTTLTNVANLTNLLNQVLSLIGAL